MMRIALKPRLTAPLAQTTEQYIDFWGAELYNDYCSALGLTPMIYRDWEAATRERGVDWWHKCLELSMIKQLPPLDDYCMLLRTSHPDEVKGPRRFYFYAQTRIQMDKMTTEQAHEMLWNELGGHADPAWYEGVVAHLDIVSRRVRCCPWLTC